MLREDGAAVPLPLLLHDGAGAEPGRERRLAGGDLPPGRYSALAIRVTGVKHGLLYTRVYFQKVLCLCIL